jgi:ABC-type transport system involved in cytochrome c biogenesis permease subunit
MMELQSILFWGATTCYAVATALFFVGGAFGCSRCIAAGRLASMVGLLPHGAAIALRWLEVGHGPYSSRYEVISANAFVLVVIYLLVSLLIPRLKGVGVFVFPAAFLMMGWGVSSFDVKTEVPIIFKSYWLFLHIGFAKAFAATNLVAGGCAAAILIKERNPQRLPAMPAPVKLEQYAAQFLLVSFFFLGVMIVAGSLWAHQSWGRYWGWDPIESSALVSWLMIGIVLHLRTLHSWTGQRFAWLTMATLASALITIYVVTLVVPTIHNSYLVGK